MTQLLSRFRILPLLLASLAGALNAPIAAAAPEPSAARLLVRFAGDGADAGRLDVVDAARGKLVESLAMRCDRAHYGAGVLACLRSVPGQGLKFDLADRHGKPALTLSFPNVLLASRVRVARDGALAAFTGFSAGHTYSGTDFSVRTYLVDVVRKRLLADVSTFKVVESASMKLPAKRINVWGVTFDPRAPNRFMATVGAAGQVFLASGDIAAKTLTLLRTEMECPSFSPDGTRLAFKRRDGAGGWVPAVLDLASGREVVMKEIRSIDDQIEWLNNNTLIYELARTAGGMASQGGVTDLMMRNADGRSASSVLLANAGSPTRFD